MGKHIHGHRVHENSLATFKSPSCVKSRSGRLREVLKCVKKWGPVTARQIMIILDRHDLNEVRPRISELLKDGIIYEYDKILDEYSGRRVSRFDIFRQPHQTKFMEAV